MKNKIRFLVMVLFCYHLNFAQNVETSSRIILKLKDEINPSNNSLRKQKFVGNAKIDSINAAFNVVKIKRQSLGKKSKKYIYIIEFHKGTDIKQIIEKYYNTGEIEYAEPDAMGRGAGAQIVTPNDPFYYRQWALNNDGSFSLSSSVAGADIEMESAWDLEQGDSTIVVGIIDSGIKLNHPEFSGRVWSNHNEIQNNGMDDDGNGYIDDVQGWDFANDDNDPTDDYGHGTNVTGIIGANPNNSMGYAGVDWHCKLMVLKGLDNANAGFYSWWVEALYYSVDNGAKVINMSLGGSDTSTSLLNAINYALSNQVVVVVCMMNTNSNTIFYPAAFPGVIAVGSTNANDNRSNPFFWSSSSGSNYGNHISVVAPGNYIYGLNYQSNTNYGTYWGGTSQATPHVCGIASLLLAQDSSRTPAQIKSILETTAEDQVGSSLEDTPGWDQFYGFGRVNAYEALSVFNSIKVLEDEDEVVFILPNPSNQNFTVTFSNSIKLLQISNSLGQVILTKNVEGLTTQNVEINENGIYYLQLTSDKKIISKKLMVSK
jgi:thermitase